MSRRRYLNGGGSEVVELEAALILGFNNDLMWRSGAVTAASR